MDPEIRPELNMEEFTVVNRRRTVGGRTKTTHYGQKKHRPTYSNVIRSRYDSFNSSVSDDSPCRSPAPTPTPTHGSSRCSSRRSSCSSGVSSGSDASLHVTDDADETDIEPTIDFGQKGLETGLMLEMLILEALLNYPDMDLFKNESSTNGNHGNVNLLQFAHPEGDFFTWLNVCREWVYRLQKGTVQDWYHSHNVQESTLRKVEKHVEKRRNYLSTKFGRDISLSFGKNEQISNEVICNVILNTFCENVCVYQGHPSLGYKVISTGETVFIHPSSAVCFLSKYPIYILFADTTTNKNKQVKAVMVLNDALAMSLLDFNGSLNEIIKANVAKPCKFENLGESIVIEMENFWNGAHPYTDESLSKILKFHCNGSPLFFKKGSKCNFIAIYSLPEYHKTIRRLVEDEVQKIRKKFKEESFEMGYPDEKSNFRLLIGPGAGSKRFLFAHDFRSVWVHETKDGTLSRDFVQSEMEKYGAVADVLKADKDSENESGIWGTVTFKNPDTVVRLLASSKHHNAAMLVELAPNNNEQIQMTNPKVTVDKSVKIHLRLCRRPLKAGIAYATIKGIRNLAIVVDTKSMIIGKNRVKFGYRKGTKNDVEITGLGPLVEEKDISDALTEKLGITPSNIKIDKVPAFTSSANDLQKFKTALQRIVDKAVDVSKVSIRVFMPSPKDLFIKAEIKFQTRRIAVSAMEFLNGAKIKGLPIEITKNPLDDPEIPTVVIKAENAVFQSVKNEVKKQLTKVPTSVTVKLVSHEEYSELRLYSQNIIEAVQITSRLEELLTPLEMKLARKKVKRLLKEGEPLLMSTMEDTKTFIDVDGTSRMVRIYGTKSRISRARNKIQEFLDRHEDDEPMFFRLSLKGRNRPASLMIEVMKAIQDGRLESTGVKDIKVDTLGHSLFYSGSMHEHYMVETLIDSMCDYMDPIMIIPTDPEVSTESVSSVGGGCVECSACYCPVEGNHYTLQACRHSYCEECIDTHIKVSLEKKGFPITCTEENCGQPVCVRDIVILVRKLDGGLWKVLKASADQHVQTKPQEYGFCFQPDCKGVFQKRPQAIAYSCSLCNVKICPKCSNNYHGNQSCDDYLNNTAFTLWMSGSQDRKKCPNCRIAIEKIDGCNRVQCTSCQRHICWKCLEHFPNMTMAYDHLNREHHGYN